MSDYAVIDPATGEKVKEYPTATDAEIQSAIAAAAGASKEAARTSSIADRAALINRVAELHRERREDLADIIVREMGKPTSLRTSTAITPTTQSGSWPTSRSNCSRATARP